MSTVLKYKLPNTPGEFELLLAQNAKILSAQIQGMSASLWVLEDTENEGRKRRFVQVETGKQVGPFADQYGDELQTKFIATLQHMGGEYVLHLFEIK
jgi:hypothetical protein